MTYRMKSINLSIHLLCNNGASVSSFSGSSSLISTLWSIKLRYSLYSDEVSSSSSVGFVLLQKIQEMQKTAHFQDGLVFLCLILQRIPCPAAKNNLDYPLPPGVFNRYLAGILNGVTVGIGYGAGNCRCATLCGIDLTVLVDSCNLGI